ncbi:carboxylesterase/lipase family protein [Consotaella aegiceratis]|uniref:carboxylesterase/lipase family protein n=1 Tax=Consotaella aegiceratis TaxID=3097961 RepID=UPI002F3E605B
MDALILVDAPCGPILGQRDETGCRFLGIPYARPPLGDRRFAAPEARERFSAPWEAFAYGPAAPQKRALPQPIGSFMAAVRRFDEDCLSLNVWTPATDGARPVLVFIHGGGFIIGSSAQYPGADLAVRGDVVVVTINYRLGLLGFNGFAELYPDDPRFAANAGLLDQALALQWIRTNIAAFGGDPDRVTLAGESAGAASVAFHLVHRPSWPLFNRAILQSGGLNMFWSRREAVEVAADVVTALDADAEPGRLFSLPAAAFSRVLRKLGKTQMGILARPYLDGIQVPERPLRELYALAKPVPLLVGTTRDEFSLFSDLSLFPIQSDLTSLSGWAERVAGASRAAEIAQLYPETREGRIAFGTDILFRMPAVHFADLHAERAPAFCYRLDWPVKGLLNRLGATHSVDLPLLFDDFVKRFRSLYLGLLADPKRRALSTRMKAHWLSFVRDGRPGEDWPVYEPLRRETMIFNEVDRIQSDPEGNRRPAWDGVDHFVV